MIILIILIIVLLLSLSLINKTLKKKDNILEDVKLQESTIKNDGFALMLEKSDGSGYEESDSNTWPIDMKFNSELSGCIDTNGNKIENSLSFDSATNLVTLKTNKTSYCYVYFDIDNSLSSYLIKNVSNEELWNSPLEDDGYRFVGTNPNNHICFGTSDKETCVNDTDKYMYRIIGIFEDGAGNKHAKLIKKEALNTVYAWNSDNQTDVDWNESDLYKGINGSYFLTNTDYSYMQDSEWTDKISTWNYTMTNTKSYENHVNNSILGSNYHYETGKTMYLHELNRSGKSNESCHYSTSVSADCNVGEYKTLSTKLSLMYASDYALSLGSDALSYTSSSNSSTMKTGWMHISNNDSDALVSYEWTMSRNGYNVNSIRYSAWRVDKEGFLYMIYVQGTNSARPVFYLESNIEFSTNSGDGSLSNPYLLK